MDGLDWSIIPQSLPLLWEGMQLTLLLTFLSIVGGLFVGVVLAVARLSPIKVLSRAAQLYVNLFRSIPLVLAVFWFYFMVPIIVGRPIGPFYSVLCAFVFFEGAYFGEIIRAGIQSIRQGQVNAALATGLTQMQTLRHVILPQALRNMRPILLTRCIMIFQDTSLAYVVSLHDFTTIASIIANRDGRLVEMFVFVALVYFVLCSLANWGVNQMEKRGAA